MLKIIDFGIASILSRENPTLKNPEQLEGTLSYISPEQTGRMNRSLDYRTDLYSLGVTFYEMLTGKVPFISDSPLELVHCHIAKTPMSIRDVNPNIPPIIANIVMKLMSKNVEDRYQSAFGVKADLEKSLDSIEQLNNLHFELAQQDCSNRFQIPQKLYGREAEVEILLQAFERVSSSGKTEMMLIAGYSGVGKTALVHEVHKPMTEKCGHFASGKFAQLKRNIPYSALSEALDEFCHYLLTGSPAELNEWRKTLLTAVGNNGQILIEVIPALALIIGEQPPITKVGPTEAQNRFNRVFQRFILALSQPTHPLVLFIDDWQWADSASLNLLTLLLTDPQIQSLFIIGAYRDNEVDSSHPFMITVEELKKNHATLKQIQLNNLSQQDVNALIADTLACNELNDTFDLTSLVYDKTRGNAFFTLEFFKSLFKKELLVFDAKQQKWQWDVSKIANLDITDNVVKLMAGKINQLPSETLFVLKLAACIGNVFDLQTLSLIYQHEPQITLQHLWTAIEDGLILPLDESHKFVGTVEAIEVKARFRFQHDRVQEAGYSLIANTDQQATHLKIGRLLLANTVETQLEEKLFEIVNQFNEGQPLIDDNNEKRQLAELNLKAGQKAKDATAYAAAEQYIKFGIASLTSDNDYQLTFALHKEQAEIAYLNGHFDEAEKWINDTVAIAQSPLEKVELYFLLVKQYNHLAKQEQIIPIIKKALALLEIDLPEKEDLQAALDIEVAELKKQMTQDITGLLATPETNNPEATVLVHLLWKLIETTATTGQETFLCFTLAKVARLSLKYDAVPESSMGYLSYGLLLSACKGDHQSGYEYVSLGLKLSKKFQRQDYICLLCENVVGNISFLVKPFKSSDSLFHEGYQAGLELGMFAEIGYLIMHHVYSLFIRGEPIEKILIKITDFKEFIKKNQLTLIINFLLGIELLLWNLSGRSPDKWFFQMDEFEEAQYLADCKEDSFNTCLFQILKSQMFYLYEKPKEGHQYALKVEKSIGMLTGYAMAITHNFYYSLNLAALYPMANESEQQQYWAQLKSNQKQMKNWAEGCPENFLHQYLLIKAEMSRLSGKRLEETMDLYDRAITSAKENELIQNEALCNELAAKFWLARGKEEIAQLYFKKAHYGYQLWGAKRKVEDLEEKYPQFYIKIKTEQEQKIRTISETQMISMSSTTSSQNHSAQLDLESVMKAAQTLSGEMVLNRLLEQMMRIVIENAGASIGFLLLPKQDNWFIEAQGQVDKDEVTILQSFAVEKSEKLSENIIHYVARTKENIVLHDATKTGHFTHDSYIVKYRPKSVLCTPLLNQGKLIGILYLENNLTTGAFTANRLEMLNLLSSQLAISIENSLLYNNLEQKVTERTQELSNTLDHLKTTQAQLVESEKMASLGGLVAGVAHEINTPIGICVTAASTLADRTTDTATAYSNKQLKGSALKSYFKTAQSSSNLILNNLDRAAELIQSFKQVAVDQSNLEKRYFAVKKYIKGTLINLKPHLKKTPHQIMVNGDEQIEINSYPGAFSQTITNLVMNSLRHAYPKGKAGNLRFEIKLDSERLIVEYNDDGCGIPIEHQDKIFEPFFTTARTQGGTGLGLHIIFNLVTQKLQGTINVQSEVGVGTTFILNLPLQINNKG